METQDETARCWSVGPGVELTLDRPRLMGIVNATPDSFSDGGDHPTLEAMLEAALRLVDDGASIIDVGGESTRPGADRVGASEQIERTAPLVESVRRVSDVLISIDTTSARVAECAIDLGANIVNDVSAGREDPGMLSLAAERRCGLVLMHRLYAPGDDAYSNQYTDPPEYEDVLATVLDFLVDRARAAQETGVAGESIVIDPGLGFGKSVEQNFELIARTRELVATGYPVLAAASRKSFLGHVSGVGEPRGRTYGSTAASVAQFIEGARLFRVHDVAAHREALSVAQAVAHAGGRHSSVRSSTRPPA